MVWTPEKLFAVTFLFAALMNTGVLLVANKPLTKREILGGMIFYGGLGASFGILVVYQYFGGIDQPIKVISCGGLVGCRAIKPAFVIAAMKRILGLADTPKRNDKS